MSLTICDNCGLKGKCMHLLSGSYKREDLMDMGFEDKSISSVKIGPNTSAKLYNNGNLTGKFALLENDTFQNKTIICLDDKGLGHKISSIHVEPFRQTVTKLQEGFIDDKFIGSYITLQNILIMMIVLFIVYFTVFKKQTC